MRIRLPLGRSLFFACALLFSVAALLPLRLTLDWLALDQRGFSAREAQGSIWLGALREARFGAVPLGDITAQLRSLPLFAGQARIDLNRFDGDDPLRGSVGVSRHSFAVNDVVASLDTASLFGPLPIASVELEGVSARYANGLCDEAAGSAKATLSGEIGGIALPGGFMGKARCEGGALLLPLASQSGMEALNIRLFENDRYGVTFSVRATDPALARQLSAAGFVPAAGGMHVLQIDGEF